MPRSCATLLMFEGTAEAAMQLTDRYGVSWQLNVE